MTSLTHWAVTSPRGTKRHVDLAERRRTRGPARSLVGCFVAEGELEVEAHGHLLGEQRSSSACQSRATRIALELRPSDPNRVYQSRPVMGWVLSARSKSCWAGSVRGVVSVSWHDGLGTARTRCRLRRSPCTAGNPVGTRAGPRIGGRGRAHKNRATGPLPSARPALVPAGMLRLSARSDVNLLALVRVGCVQASVGKDPGTTARIDLPRALPSSASRHPCLH